MTATATTTSSTFESTAGAAPLQWTSPEAKLWVATRDGEFAGFVEFGEGHYLVTDGLGAELGTAATLRDAKRLLAPEAPASSSSSSSSSAEVEHGLDTGAELLPRRRRRDTILAAFATGFGISALSGALIALGILRL